MPKVTLYVKDADAPIWEKARQFAGESLSSVVAAALWSYVEEQERRTTAKTALDVEAEQIELEVDPEDRPKRKLRFKGVLAYEGGPGEADAYVTTRGKIVLQHLDGYGTAGDVTVYDDYQEFMASDPSTELGAAVAEKIGEEWIEEI